MKTVRTVRDLRRAVSERRAGGPGGQALTGSAPRADHRVGLVPTMGALHAGHRALLRRARADCDTVVMSLFVNPAQFTAGENLDAYPRDERRDARIAAVEGVDVLFAPPPDEVYPDGFDTHVEVGGLTTVLCGDPSRRGPEHFRGVTTVVTKLLNMVGPDLAYFGQKDAQQALVVRKLVRDLDMPVEIVVCPTVREPDGLAASSRNAYLDADQHGRALALSRALAAAEAAVASGERSGEAVLRAARSELDAAGVEPEYLELRSTRDLTRAERVNGSTLLAVAARIGRARLIDNTVLGER